jgi:4-diphosphocytidyl-2-C-methyl-D-erythritol kinase
MPCTVRSFAKINIGLSIGPSRSDGFHELRTVYQTVAVNDLIRVDVKPGSGIEIRCKDARVPTDETNTCYRIADRVLRHLKQRSKVSITIEKNLPVQGGIGAGSANAVATLFGLQRCLKVEIAPHDMLRMAGEVGSDLPLFLLGGTVLGCGHGEEVYPLPDLPALPLVLITPKVAVSTPAAFKAWDVLAARELTQDGPSVTMNTFSRSAFEWLSGMTSSGVPVNVNGDRAETLLLDLVRAGIANDFERVVFNQHPELRDMKRVLEREGASYASLSGSGSSLYGLFRTSDEATRCAARLKEQNISAIATQTLPRSDYRNQLFIK